MGVLLSKIKKEPKSEQSFQQYTRRSHRRTSFTLDWTRRKRSKANRASTRSENFSQEINWKDNTKSRAKWHADINADQTFDKNRRHTTTVVEQSENKNSSTLNHFQDACIPTNQDTTASQNVRIHNESVKPEFTNKSNFDIVHEMLHIEPKQNRRTGKAKSNKKSQTSSTAKDMKTISSSLLKDTGDKSTRSPQHSQISSTNQKNSLLANNTNSLVRDSDISKIGSKEAASVKLNKKNTSAESKMKIRDVNAQAVIQSRNEAISYCQEKKTVQHENLQKAQRNYENQKQAILHGLLNKLASVELEDKTEKNIQSESEKKVIGANSQEVIEPIDEIRALNNQIVISDGEGKIILQPKNLQVVKQNYESREKTILLSHILEIEKEKINLTWQDFINFKKDTGIRQNCDNATLAIEDRSNMDGKSKEENSAPTILVDVTPKFETVVSTTEQNDDENISNELTILFQEYEVQNEPICDQVVKSGNVETDEDNLQCQDADELVYKSTKYESWDPVFLPIVCDNVKLQTTKVNIPIEAVDETSISCKVSKPKQLITNLENKKVGEVVIYVEKECIPSEKTELECSIVTLLQNVQTIPQNSDEHVDALWLSSKQLQVKKTAEDTIIRKNRKTFMMQDGEEISLYVHKANQENSISENTFCTKVTKDQTSLLDIDVTVNQKDPKDLYYTEDEIKTEDITNNNIFIEKFIDESDNASDKVSKPRKDETDNVFEDLMILEELLKEDNLKTTSLTEKKTTNSSLNARDEIELVEQEITDYTVAKKIEEIKCKAEPFGEEIEAFFELKDSNKYFYIEESLQRLVAKLDDMSDEIGNDEWLRQRRKFVYKFIFSLFDALDEKVKINARNVQL